MMNVSELTDDDLVARLRVIHADSKRLLALFLMHLGEVDARKLYRQAACSSMFEFCTRKLGMSEGSTSRRLASARAVRRFPDLLPRIERGDLHVTALSMVACHLTEENHAAVIADVIGRTTRQVEEVVARLAPKPDVPSWIRRLPERNAASPGGASVGSRPCAATVLASVLGGATSGGEVVHPAAGAPLSSPPPVMQPTAGGTAPSLPPSPPPQWSSPPPSAADPTADPWPRAEAPRPTKARITPRSVGWYKVQLMASKELVDKIDRATDLMRHANPSGDHGIVLHRALDLLIAKLEKERLGKTTRPQTVKRPSKRGHVSNATRRRVFERDGERCTFVDAEGHRCDAKSWLELDHIESRAIGGSDDESNLRVRCRAHNQLHAEDVFGKAHVASKIRSRRAMARPRNDVPAEMRPSDPTSPARLDEPSCPTPALTGDSSGPSG